MRDSIHTTISSIVLCLKTAWETSACYTVLRIVAKIVIPLCGLAFSFLSRNLINALTKEEISHELLFLVVLIFCFSALSSTLSKVVIYIQEMHNKLIEKETQLSIMEKILDADIAFFDDPDYLDAYSFAHTNAYALTNLLWNSIDIISSMISLIVVFIAIAQMNPLYGVLLLLASFPAGIVARYFTQQSFRLTKEQLNIERRKGYIVTLTSNKEFASDIRLFQIGSYLRGLYLALWEKAYRMRKRLLQKKVLFSIAFELLPLLLYAYIVFDMAEGIVNGLFTIGDLTFWITVSSQLQSHTSIFVSNLLSIYENKLHSDQLKKFNNISVPTIPNGEIAIEQINTIEFSHVDFEYPGTQTKTLDSVSFAVKAGEHLILVGENGSGKSTIIKLILRFYDITGGNIFVNGIDIKQLEIGSLRRCMSAYFQESQNYAFTIRENIGLSDISKDATNEKAVTALKKSKGENILTKGKAGLDSHLFRLFHDDTIELSGGEMQKIALARTFFRDCSVLILDEPSSALDPMSENEIFSIIKESTGSKITILTSHRLATAVQADKIIVLESGRIIEQGSHHELMLLHGKYHEMFHYQADRYQAQGFL